MNTALGSVAPELRLYIDLLSAVTRYCAIVGWTVLNWILFNQLINKQAGSQSDSTGDGPHITSIIVKSTQLCFRKIAQNLKTYVLLGI